jgi:hypothetical protein
MALIQAQLVAGRMGCYAFKNRWGEPWIEYLAVHLSNLTIHLTTYDYVGCRILAEDAVN